MITRRQIFTGIPFLYTELHIKKSFSQTPSQDLTRKQIARSTVEILSKQGTGTGFLFCFSDRLRKGKLVGIITNKHVAKMSPPIYIRHVSQNQAKIIELPDFHKQMIEHPDSEIDLCVSFATGPISSSEDGKYSMWFDYDLIPTKEILQEYDDASRCLVVGYPKGIIDEAHGEPIFRSGICASRPDKMFSGSHGFLIDASIWGGSSGSPVILYDQPNDHTMGPITPYLVGIVQATELQAIDTIAKDSGGKFLPDFDHYSPNNLGVCVASDMILPLAREAARQYPWLLDAGLILPEREGFQS